MVEVRFLQSSEVLQELRHNLSYARSFRSAVAFLRKTGYAEVRADLVGLLKRGRQAELVIGISGYGITDWESLRELLRLRDRYRNLTVRYYYNEGFHPKLFIFELPGNEKSIVLGSSNLTGGGVGKNVEANVLLRGTRSDRVLADIDRFFENTCFLPAKKLTSVVVRKYKPISGRSRSIKGREKGLGIAKTDMPPMSESGVDVKSPGVLAPALQARFWKISPGSHASEWPLWRKEIEVDSRGRRVGIVAIGWGFDISRLPVRDHIALEREIYRKLRRARRRSYSGYVTGQVQDFAGMRRNDIVVAYSASHIWGIAQVTDDTPYHVDTRGAENETYENRRRVRWLTLRKWRPPKRIMKFFAYPNDTIHRITSPAAIRRIGKQLATPRFEP
jgi:HKD family nuclease